MVRVGLAMLQGARHEHIEALHNAALELNLSLEIVELRKGGQVSEALDALVLPGGESTAMRKASESEALLPAIYQWMDQHPERPVLGTCAGAILLSSPGECRSPYIDVDISRNAWGRQRQSFEAYVEVDLDVASPASIVQHRGQADQFNHRALPVEGATPDSLSTAYHGVFIRAPRFDTSSVKCLAVAHLGEEAVGVIDGSKLALTFHPELTGDYRFHRWLLTRAEQTT